MTRAELSPWGEDTWVFTIGHSNLEFEDFLARLRNYDIERVLDVRSQPVSRYTPHFSHQPLAHALEQHGVGYVFMGDTLGGRPADTRYYDEAGFVRYDLLSESDDFAKGLAGLQEEAERASVALLCAEEDPARCHRHLLVARALAGQGLPRERILHIRSSGDPLPDSEIGIQGGLFGGEGEWKSPQSVLHKVQPSTSSAGSRPPESNDW
jgi:uncharacterized protein (DUF488 family)